MATQTHHGGCHCGAVRYTVEIDLAQPVIACNCSICRMKGLRPSFVADGAVTIEQGEDALTDYRFNTEAITHRFCKVCGVQPLHAFKDGGVAVNVCTLDGVGMDALTLMPFDGASR